jgi:signal transduction histidine kinase
MPKTKKISFRISARTARLIGRQNFPNAEGAIIELVKNSYDADASTCIVIFDNYYAMLPQSLSTTEYDDFMKHENLISEYYELEEIKKRYVLKESSSQNNNDDNDIKTDKNRLQEFFRSQCKLYIIDNGEGMTDKIIEDFWMTIGTNNKELDIFTKTRRVKTGAKGIGRFALDKLGDNAEMLTKPDPRAYPGITNKIAFLWDVNWNDFEGERKTLNDVQADLIDIEVPDFSDEVSKVLPIQAREYSELKVDSFGTGTKIEVNNLRDVWDDYSVQKLFSSLEALIPPREEKIFDIFLFSTLEQNKYGRVSPSVCDDFDYKLEAHVDANGMAEIIIYRNEFEVERFPNDFFNQGVMSKEAYSKQSFEKGEILVKRRIGELDPGLRDVDDAEILKNIGEFSAVFYFMKATTTERDREVFLFKNFNSAARKAWFKHFGGIKLFRDDFRVRPYGEIKNAAFDWLQLGERATRSPSSIGQQRPESWNVRPNQIAGVINISRLTNISFEDTSSRYGLQENRTFLYFTRIILGIINIFEKDRTDIGGALRAYFHEKHKDSIPEEKVVEEVKERVKKSQSKRRKSQVEEDSVTLLKVAENLEEQVEELKNETILLRILASSSLITASFTHELTNIKDNLVFRVDEVQRTLHPLLDENNLGDIPEYLNPFIMLDDIKHEDEKLKEWLYYSLESLRRDKRLKKDLELSGYFTKYKKNWRVACDERGVTLQVILPKLSELTIRRVFEADLDCIFNNLLVNSFEAFLRTDAPPERIITIKVEVIETDILFTYTDSGPGLSKDIVEPERIFEPHFTTKKDARTGEDIGTGLGMWLVKSFVSENNGIINLLINRSGFGVSIKFIDKIKQL